MPTTAHSRPRSGLLPAIGIPLLLAGCAQLPFQTPTRDAGQPADIEPELETAANAETAIPEPQESPEPGQLYEWNGHGRSISHVVINTDEQRARFYDGPDQVGWTTIASGVSSHPTPRGEFSVIEKVKNKRSNLYGRIYDASGQLHKRSAHARRDPIPSGGKFVGARMPHFMRMTYDGIGMHAGDIPQPGQPASHGCIRLPNEIASNLFAHVDVGTRVTVVGDGPDYGNYAERIQRQREQERQNRVAAASAERQATSQLSSNAAEDGARSRPASGSTQSPEARSSVTDATGASVLASARGGAATADSDSSTRTQPPAEPESTSTGTPRSEQRRPESAQQPDANPQPDRTAGASPADGGETGTASAPSNDGAAAQSVRTAPESSTSSRASASPERIETDASGRDGPSQTTPESAPNPGTGSASDASPDISRPDVSRPDVSPDAGQESASDNVSTEHVEALAAAPSRAEPAEFEALESAGPAAAAEALARLNAPQTRSRQASSVDAERLRHGSSEAHRRSGSPARLPARLPAQFG